MNAQIHAQISLVPVIALESAMAHEVLLGVAAAITLLGTWLCWRAASYRMGLEESVKDGEISDDEASRKIRRSFWTGPTVTIIGVSLLLYSILG